MEKTDPFVSCGLKLKMSGRAIQSACKTKYSPSVRVSTVTGKTTLQVDNLKEYVYRPQYFQTWTIITTFLPLFKFPSCGQRLVLCMNSFDCIPVL